jgi:hypothetical protein
VCVCECVFVRKPLRRGKKRPKSAFPFKLKVLFLSSRDQKKRSFVAEQVFFVTREVKSNEARSSFDISIELCIPMLVNCFAWSFRKRWSFSQTIIIKFEDYFKGMNPSKLPIHLLICTAMYIGGKCNTTIKQCVLGISTILCWRNLVIFKDLHTD